MEKSIDNITRDVLLTLAETESHNHTSTKMSGPEIHKYSRFRPSEINDAVAILEAAGLVEVFRGSSNAPYQFDAITLTTRGRYESDRFRLSEGPSQTIIHPPSPVGSPYGFHDIDWEIVAQRKAEYNTLFVCMGYQFHSSYYDTDLLKKNTKLLFTKAVDAYSQLPGSNTLQLLFQPLEAGLGEHLFNEIARDVISADVAVFETSDLNPNVMLEMGVALTWGVRVVPIKNVNSQKPPSDISGQTWLDYSDSGATFIDKENVRKIGRMVERAARKKISK